MIFEGSCTKKGAMRVLLTGTAGFIGMHTAVRLLQRGDEVIGLDRVSPETAERLPRMRLGQLQGQPGFRSVQGDLADREALARLFDEVRPQRVIHLAAQSGVRRSLSHAHEYVDSNLAGFQSVLEGCRRIGVEHLVYASSSSVYGGSTRLPYSERDGTDHPLSIYAATKKANELMAHAYSHAFGLPCTGLRLFNVYGPWGRPDMAPMLFAEAIIRGDTLQIFNHGQMLRDFTYVDDVVEGLVRVLDRPATPAPGLDPAQPGAASSAAPWRIFNLGNNQPVPLWRFVQTLEQALGRTAPKEFLPMQPGDMPATAADTHALEEWIGFKPHTPLETGIARFVEWFEQVWRAEAQDSRPEPRQAQGRVLPPA
jgi:UDP-glucuronate 4-epimerase